MATADLRKLLASLQQHGVEYILVGGHAVRLYGFNRATEDIDLVVPFDTENGARLIRSLDFLPSAREMQDWWFSQEANADEIQNIRIADDLVVDILFSANGETYESLQPHIRKIEVDGVVVRTLDVEGLLRTKASQREKDLLDCLFLSKIK